MMRLGGTGTQRRTRNNKQSATVFHASFLKRRRIGAAAFAYYLALKRR